MCIRLVRAAEGYHTQVSVEDVESDHPRPLEPTNISERECANFMLPISCYIMS